MVKQTYRKLNKLRKQVPKFRMTSSRKAKVDLNPGSSSRPCLAGGGTLWCGGTAVTRKTLDGIRLVTPVTKAVIPPVDFSWPSREWSRPWSPPWSQDSLGSRPCEWRRREEQRGQKKARPPSRPWRAPCQPLSRPWSPGHWRRLITTLITAVISLLPAATV